MNNIPTAAEVIRAEFVEGEFDEIMAQVNTSIEPDITHAMITFAKLHVQAALKEALDNVPYGSSTDTVSYEDVKGILTCYDLNNIK